MAKKKKSEALKSVTKDDTQVEQPKFKTKTYTLIKDVEFSDGTKKKGEKVSLTEEGRKYFKSQNFIE